MCTDTYTLNRPQWAIKLFDCFGKPVRVVVEEGYFFSFESASARATELNNEDDPYTVCNFFYAATSAEKGGL